MTDKWKILSFNNFLLLPWLFRSAIIIWVNKYFYDEGMELNT